MHWKMRSTTKKQILKELTSTANMLSLSRIPLAATAIMVFDHKIMLFIIFALTWLTDILDGWFARKQGQTKYGPTIDPLADKAFFIIIFIYLLATGRIDWWILSLLLLRDILVILLSVFVWLHPGREKIVKVSGANWIGKITTGCQFITIIWLVTGIPGFEVGAYAAAILGIAATIEYIILVRRTLSASPK